MLIILKIATALVGLSTGVIISRAHGEQNLINYFLFVSIVTILTSLMDRGASIKNGNVQLENHKWQNINSNSLQATVSYVGIALCLFYINISFNYNHSITSIILLNLSVFLSATSQLYLSRWSLIQRRSGEVLLSVTYGEFFVSIVRFMASLISIYFSIIIFLVLTAIFLIFYGILLNYTKRIESLRLIERNQHQTNTSLKLSNGDLTYSIVSSVKDQVLSALVPLADIQYQYTLAMFSRVHQIVMILLSPVYLKLPLYIKESMENKIRFNLFLIIFALLTMSIFINPIILFMTNIYGNSESIIGLSMIKVILISSPMVFSYYLVYKISDNQTHGLFFIEITSISLVLVGIFL